MSVHTKQNVKKEKNLKMIIWALKKNNINTGRIIIV